MKLTYLGIDGIKGRRAGITIPSGCGLLALGGGVGSGKSAVIDGLHLLLGLPTRIPQTMTDRLSPSGEWGVTGEFDGDIKRLENGRRRGRSFWEVNGRAVKSDEYFDSARTILDVEPHHVSLNEFMNLSGQKRAALFASMLESAQATVLDAVGGQVKTVPATLEDFAVPTLGNRAVEFLGLFSKLNAIIGTPAQVAEAVKEICNQATQAERDARVRLEGLVNQASASTSQIGSSPAELRARLQEIDQEIGGLNSQRHDMERRQSQHQAAGKLIEKAIKAEDQAKVALDAAQKTKAELPAIAAAHDEVKSRHQAALERLEAADGSTQNARSANAALVEEQQKLVRARDLLNDLMNQDWDVPMDWLREEVESFVHDVTGMSMAGTDADWNQVNDRSMRFAKEIVAEVLGGDMERLGARVAELDQKINQGVEAMRGLTDEHAKACNAFNDTTNELREHANKLAAAQNAVDLIPELEKKLHECSDILAKFESDAKTVIPMGDDAILLAQIEQFQSQRGEISGQLTALEKAMAISGQVEGQRVEVTRAGLKVDFLKSLSAAVQRWRDGQVREKVKDVMKPFTEAFAAIFGGAATLKHESSGQGRTTEFLFSVDRGGTVGGGTVVPFELLSDGESVLAAAAFLSALQKIKKGPGSLLTINSEPLDGPWLTKLLIATPKLGMDLVVIANNRFKIDTDHAGSSPLVAAWCVYYDMDKPPALKT